MAGEMSSFEGRLRKRRREVKIEEMRSRHDSSRRKNRKKIERTECVVLALEAQRREVPHEEANERDADAVLTMVAENQQVGNRETGETADGEMSSMQADGNENQKEDVMDIAAESEDTQALSETILEENQVTGHQVGGVIQEEEHDQENQAEIENKENHAVDNREVIVIVDEDNQADNQGVIEARELIEIDDQENKVDEENKVETEAPENQYLYVGTDDWPTTWNYEEQMVWGLGLRSSPNPDIEYIYGIGWVKKNLIH